MYSAPIPVMSEATAVGWTNAPAHTDNITCIADGATAISPRPQPAITINGSAPGLYDNAAAVLLTVVDNELTQYPGYIALASRRFDLNIATNALGQPQVQRGVGDVPTVRRGSTPMARGWCCTAPCWLRLSASSLLFVAHPAVRNHARRQRLHG